MDRLQRGMNAGQDLRVVGAITTEAAKEACRRHELRGSEAVVLGRAITAGCLLATLTKRDDERLRLDIQGGGPVGRILVDAHGDGRVRGCLQRRLPQPEHPARDHDRTTVAHLVGTTGRVIVTRDIGLEQEYQGVTDLVSGELDADLERYLTVSEQLPSVLACEVVLDARDELVRCAGVLVQTFPGTDPEALAPLRDNLRGSAFGELLRHDRTPSELMGFAVLGQEVHAAEAMALRFSCNCGFERALNVVSTLGADEVEELAYEQETTDVRCSYCGETYVLTRGQLIELAKRIREVRS